jgi:hypothetical protein
MSRLDKLLKLKYECIAVAYTLGVTEGIEAEKQLQNVSFQELLEMQSEMEDYIRHYKPAKIQKHSPKKLSKIVASILCERFREHALEQLQD